MNASLHLEDCRLANVRCTKSVEGPHYWFNIEDAGGSILTIFVDSARELLGQLTAAVEKMEHDAACADIQEPTA